MTGSIVMDYQRGSGFAIMNLTIFQQALLDTELFLVLLVGDYQPDTF
jgi:hypothetical protein